MSKYFELVKEKLKDNFDLKYRELETAIGLIYVVYIDDLCNSSFISEYIIGPIIQEKDNIKDIDNLKKGILSASYVDDITNFNEAMLHILSGDVLLIFEYNEKVLYCEAKGFSKRDISTADTENAIKGPREAFSETAVDNVALIRKRIKNADLKFESFYIGKKSNTTVFMTYIKEVAEEDLIDRIRDKLKNMDPDFILDSNYISEQLSSTKTFFDTTGFSEKADIICSKLYEGRVGVIVDGSPFVMTVPYFFIEGFHAPDDYYINKYYSNAARILREIAFLISVFLPGLYLAITTYHFSLIPSVFVFRLAVSRAGVPFPSVVELILMMFFFAILREAGIRLPQPIGQAASIVGALILGDAAIGAGLASQIGLIIVAVSSIAAFLVPKLYSPSIAWSIIIILFSSLLGLPGFYIIMLTFVAHISSLDSVGYPYLYPLGTAKEIKLRDILFRRDLEDISKNIGRDDLNEEDIN
ncbi:spore germination protein [uncultured Clostridium sp.]|uniref:spore germination protein n=1 Tax=uncultured Clostridium sp. TaxID=59620 RepID=UPI0028EC0D80|nr:spore germination protein [uncultured Clostridium sp.]